MDEFLAKFFPVVLAKKRAAAATENAYCKYNDQKLQAFTSSLYIAGLVATFFASYVTRNYGRKATMLCAGISFCVGVLLNAAAQEIIMLILGRIMLGVGVGFANQVGLSILLLIILFSSWVELQNCSKMGTIKTAKYDELSQQ